MTRSNRNLCRAGCVLLAVLPWVSAHADIVCDTSGLPVVSIGYPSDGEVVTDPNITLTGDVTGHCLSGIFWTLGGAEFPISASTGWDGFWQLDPTQIVLPEAGDHQITVIARSHVGESETSVAVTYEPPPPPPPVVAGEMTDPKGKMTANRNANVDRMSNVSYLRTDAAFEMPCETNIIVRVYARDPEAPTGDMLLVEEELEAGDFSTCTATRYRRVGSRDVVAELSLTYLSDQLTYAYLFVDNTSFPFPLAKDHPDYLQYVATIEAYRIELEFNGTTWAVSSDGPDDNWFKVSTCDELNETVQINKVELRCNR